MSEHTTPANPKPPSVDRLSELWRRINDHKMVQWSVAYVALAYGVQHAVTLITEAFEWPHAVERVSMLLLVLGLPVVITLAWYHGARASRRISGPELTIISILLVMSSLLFYVFVRPSAEFAAPAAQQAGVTAARSASASIKGAISVAVLPFLNLSSDKEQEFFSDGMTEEITAALAQIPGLRVTGRTSAFEFKGQNKDLRTIGQALGVSHLIEGSVRKAGNRVRITAQLVKADDDTHLWAENYDRDLTDVFAIQEEIAKAIAASLRVPLGLRQGDTLVRSRSKDEAVYEDYLRAKAIVRARGVQRLDDAVALLESVVARDTEFAPGWAQLAEAYALTRNEDLSADLRRTANDVSLPKAEAAARRAIRLDANSVDGYVSLALVQTYRGQWLTAEDLFKQALTLDPNSSDALHRYSLLLAGVGRPKEALAMRRRLQGLEPFVPVFNESTAGILFVNQQYDAAIAVLKGLPKGFAVRGIDLAMTYAAMGRYSEAADTLLEFSAPYAAGSVEEAARLLRAAPKPVSMPQTLPSFGNLDFVYLYVGAPDRALERDEREVGSGYFGTFTRYLWHPSYAPVRKTERFKAFVRKAGLVDYWRARGWPDLCHPTAGEDFECN